MILNRIERWLIFFKNSFKRFFSYLVYFILYFLFFYFHDDTRENLRWCIEQVLWKIKSKYIMLFNKYETVLLWDLPDVPDTFILTNSVMLIACGIKLWRITVFGVVQSLSGMFKGESKGKRKYSIQYDIDKQ